MKNTESFMIGMKSKDSIQLGIVKLDKLEKYPENSLPKNGLYRYLYQHGEQHGDQKRQTIGFIWIKRTYKLYRAVEKPGNPVFYYLQDGPGRAMLSENLMNVLDDIKVSESNRA